MQQQPQIEPLAIVSLVLGIMSWICSCCGGMILGGLVVVIMPLSIGGLACGIVSQRRIKAEPEFYDGQPIAIIGIILNLALTLLLMLMGLLMVLAIVGVIGFPLIDQMLNGY